MVHKKHVLARQENEKNGTVTKGSDEMQVMYANIVGIITRLLELQTI